MKILIAYATTEGHTGKIADFAAKRIADMGHDAEAVDLRRKVTADLDGADAVILAGSVHQRRHQDELAAFIIAHRDKLPSKRTLFVSVSLSAAFPGGEAEAQGYVDGFLSYLEWTPGATLLVAGALKHDEYDFFKEQIIEHIVLKDRTVDDPKGDHDFTDWDALGKAVEEFVKG